MGGLADVVLPQRGRVTEGDDDVGRTRRHLRQCPAGLVTLGLDAAHRAPRVAACAGSALTPSPATNPAAVTRLAAARRTVRTERVWPISITPRLGSSGGSYPHLGRDSAPPHTRHARHRLGVPRPAVPAGRPAGAPCRTQRTGVHPTCLGSPRNHGERHLPPAVLPAPQWPASAPVASRRDRWGRWGRCGRWPLPPRRPGRAGWRDRWGRSDLALSAVSMQPLTIQVGTVARGIRLGAAHGERRAPSAWPAEFRRRDPGPTAAGHRVAQHTGELRSLDPAPEPHPLQPIGV